MQRCMPVIPTIGEAELEGPQVQNQSWQLNEMRPYFKIKKIKRAGEVPQWSGIPLVLVQSPVPKQTLDILKKVLPCLQLSFQSYTEEGGGSK